jgi:hypothetical protein
VGTGALARPVERSSTIRTITSLSALLHQLETLQHSETMLLINDHQPELFEFNLLLDQGVRANHQLRISLCNMPSDFALAVFFKRTCQKNDSIP